MESPVKQRLILFIKFTKNSKRAFEKQAGLSNGYVNNIKNSVSHKKLESITLHYPDLNPSWLLTGEGEMLKSANPLAAVEEKYVYMDGEFIDMTVKERIKYFIEYKGESERKFCINIGVSASYVNSIRKSIQPEKLNSIAIHYPELNKEWLLTGEGEMLKSNKEPLKPANQQKTGVPYYDTDITASITESFNDVREKPEFYVDFKPFNDCTAYLPVYGDSMYPAYASGEIVAVKLVENKDIIWWGEAYLIITNELADNMKTVKLIYQHENKDMIILRASNPNFKGDTVIPKEAIQNMYLIKGKITRKQL